MGKVGKTPPGTAPDEHFVLIVAFPRTPFYRGRQLGDLGGYRKGAGSSADWFSLVFRCRSLGKGRELGTPLMESAFVAVGLKCGSGDRRAADSRPYGQTPKPSLLFVGAGHWPARRGSLRFPEPTLIRLACARHLPPCRGKACGRPHGAAPTARTGPGALARQTQAHNGTAPAAIFANPGPSGPAGI